MQVINKNGKINQTSQCGDARHNAIKKKMEPQINTDENRSSQVKASDE